MLTESSLLSTSIIHKVLRITFIVSVVLVVRNRQAHRTHFSQMVTLSRPRTWSQCCVRPIRYVNTSHIRLKSGFTWHLYLQEIDPKLLAMAQRAGSFGGGRSRYNAGGGGGGGARYGSGTFKRGQIGGGRGGSGGGGYRGGQSNGMSNGSSGGASGGHKRFGG